MVSTLVNSLIPGDDLEGCTGRFEVLLRRLDSDQFDVASLWFAREYGAYPRMKQLTILRSVFIA
jgi:hypothetical protein